MTHDGLPDAVHAVVHVGLHVAGARACHVVHLLAVEGAGEHAADGIDAVKGMENVGTAGVSSFHVR